MNPWTALSGYKTTIAAVVLIAAAVLDQVVVGIWNAGPLLGDGGECVARCWVPKFGDTLDWLGMALGGAGLIHKGVKVAMPAAPKPTE